MMLLLTTLFRRLRRLARRYNTLLRTVLVPLLFLYFVDILLHAWSHEVPRPAQDLDEPFATRCQDPQVAAGSRPRANATLVMLAQNSDVESACETVRNVDRQFNQWFQYPILYLNDDAWDPAVVARLRKCGSGNMTFDVIPSAEWSFPEGMDVKAAKASIKAQGANKVFKAGMESYHHMCRFFSGRFYMIEALKQYRWYWRIEPGVKYSCAITYDPFVEMERRGKTYGYTAALWEIGETCPSLFRAVDDFRKQQNIPATPMWKALIEPSWAPLPIRRLLGWLGISHYDRTGNVWNLCHYWSNFEIADLDFFRGEAYQDLFHHLDREGGFYYERWGDAPVHSLAVHLLLPPEKVHHFSDVGYSHPPFFQCPGNAPGGQLLENSALGPPDENMSPERPGAVGCRCECIDERRRNIQSVCLAKVQAPMSYHRPTWLQRFRKQYPYTVNIP